MNNEDQILSLLVEMNGRLGTMEKEITGVKQEVSGIKAEITGVKQEVSGIKAEITGVKQEVFGIKAEITRVEQEVSGIKQQLDRVEQDVSNVSGQVEENTRILGALEHRVEENSAKIEGLSVGMAKEFGAVRAEMKIAHEAQEERLIKIEKIQEEEVSEKLDNMEEKLDIVTVMQERLDEHGWEIRKLKKKLISYINHDMLE